MRHTVTVKTRQKPPVKTRSGFRVRLERGHGFPAAGSRGGAMVAAGILRGYELTQGSPIEYAFLSAAEKDGYTRFESARWPYEGLLDEGDEGVVTRDGDSQALYRLADGTLAYVRLGYGSVGVSTAAATRSAAVSGVAAFRLRYPATQLTIEDNRVPITFWTLAPYGPVQRLRMIEASPWESIDRNYPAHVRGELAALMDGFEPGAAGQLILWQGPPGTGKTWALRALASEWIEWAEFHYITDPDAFFVTEPSYMIDVLLHDSYDAVNPDTGEVVVEEGGGKWRVLVLEDTGELLSADARERSGQGLSRLLNVVDGMIGQGLRVLVLVTTNDELGELNAAVRRPGRCASQIVFDPMTPEEAAEWSGGEVGEAATLAELYAKAAGGGTPAIEEDEPEPEPDPMPLPGPDRAAASGGADQAWDALMELARQPLPEEPTGAARTPAEPLPVGGEGSPSHPAPPAGERLLDG